MKYTRVLTHDGFQSMKIRKVQYSKLNSRQKEVFNFQKIAGLLAEYRE